MEKKERIDCPLQRGARRHPDALAVLGDRERWTYADLERYVAGTEKRIQEIEGLGPRVALLLPNGRDLIVLLLALLRAQRTACILSTRLPPQRVTDNLHRLGATTLIATRDRIQTHRDISGGKEIVCWSPNSLVASDSQNETALVTYSCDQPATILFTSGSTDTPKAALHTVGNHYYSALGSNENLPVEEGDRWLLSLPLYHVGGLGIVWRCLLGGGTVIIPSRRQSVSAAIVHEAVTHVSLVPTQFKRVLDDLAVPPSTLKAVLLGGSAVPPSLLDRSWSEGWPVHTTYGLTEMTSQVTTTPPLATRDQLRTAGQVLPYRELKIAEDGEILVAGPTLFAGYIKSSGKIDPAVDQEGWYHTKDTGWLDDTGQLHVVGRQDHLFISGGENIQPEEIEAALLEHPAVARAIVVPVPDEEYGERPVAFVDGPAPDAFSQLVDELKTVLPRFKIPDAIYTWPAAVTKGMKVDRKLLQMLALERALEQS